MPRGNSVSARDEFGVFQKHFDWDAILPVIIDRMAAGETLTKISEEPDMPSAGAVAQQVRMYHPDKWLEQYEAAQRARAEVYADKLDCLFENIVDGTIDPQAGRTAAYLGVTRMAQLAPKRYNDKVIHQNIKHDVTVSVRDRLAKQVEPPTIDAEVVEIAE